ncbi:MAG: arylsulfatase [Acidobacteria bacterium]|nr:arylsulfatase [Acidobacteriota bacterium]
MQVRGPMLFFVWAIVFSPFGGYACGGGVLKDSPEADYGKPNIVFILADDLGYGHLGCYGQRIIQTPRLDRMAQEGLRFTRAYSGGTVCAPSRACLMTGLHGGHASVRANTGGTPLAEGEVTLGDVMRSGGYVTAAFGKWGLGDMDTVGVPLRRGFDEFFGYLHQAHAHFYYPEYLWRNSVRFPFSANIGGQTRQYTHDLIMGRALEFVRAHRHKPFFLYLAFTIPHYELLVPEGPHLDRYKGKFPETPYRGRGRPTGYPTDYAAQDYPRATTAAMITYMDQGIGQLLDLIQELGIDRQTIVFFTSDNGPATGPSDPDFFDANGPLRGYKRDLYEGGIRVPMIVRWPGRIKAGSISDFAWYFADVLPTLAELASASTQRPRDGISVLPVLLGHKPPQRRSPMFWEYWASPEGPETQAILEGDWKIIHWTDDSKTELYDIGRDIGESRNLAARRPEVVRKLLTAMRSCRSDPPEQAEPTKPAGARWR